MDTATPRTDIHKLPSGEFSTTDLLINGLRLERDDLRDVLIRNGFVECDIAACNCGSWHLRYGYPERMAELKDILEESGHPLTNSNGNLIKNALQELIAERDALRNNAEELIASAERVARLEAALRRLLTTVEPSDGVWLKGSPIDEARQALGATK